MAGLRVDILEGRAAEGSLMFSRTRHFSFARPDGRLSIESASLAETGLKLFCVRSTGHEVALAEEVHLNLIMPLRGRIAVAAEGRDHLAGPGDLLLFAPNQRRTVVEPDEDGVYEAIVMARPATSAGGTPARMLPARHSLATGRLAGDIHALLAMLRQTPTAPPRPAIEVVAARLDEAIMMLAVSAARAGSRPGGRRQLRLAEEFMRAHAGRPLRIAEIAAAAGLSVRGLQASFQRHRGVSPNEALSRMRLEEARLRLLCAPASTRVTDVALLAGFTHLGRFSQSYARRFGEAPSATLRRARAGEGLTGA